MSEFERKPDGGLNNWIETYEAMGGGENDAEMLCLLLELRRRRENQTKAERERDELKASLIAASNMQSIHREACQKAEAELARRDAMASERVATHLVYSSVLPKFICDTNEVESYSCFISGNTPPRKTMEEAYADAYQVCGPLYTAAPQAVLPPAIGTREAIQRLEQEDIPGSVNVAYKWGYNQCRADAMALGAQPQRSVVLPGRYDIEEMSGDPWQSYRCIEPNEDGEYMRLDEVLTALDDAGVPYEVKK